MKRIAVALLSLSVATVAVAQSRTEQEIRQGVKGTGRYGTAGCGLGSMAFGDQAGALQIVAATLNGIMGNQTFGITFGTSNCGPGLFAEGTRNFVEANREVLAKDMSRGGGESIGALTVMHGCADSQAVGAALQARFPTIFPSEAVTDAEVADAILETLRADASLGCHQG